MIESYVKSEVTRAVVNLLYFVNYFLLGIYLLIIPIQIAFYWKLVQSHETIIFMRSIDITILVLFVMHVVLYFDAYLLNRTKKRKNNKNRFSQQQFFQIVSLQLCYDLACVIFMLVLVMLGWVSHLQRIFQVIFFFKAYKLQVFKSKCMYTVIGTPFLNLYKIAKALLTVFVAVSYIGSIFYGVAYMLYLYAGPLQVSLLWIVDTAAVDDLVGQTFLMQLLYTMYWAMSTASTAAYGDISAIDPVGVFFNILALLFEGFLFGYYMNTMHSIPMQLRESQIQLIDKFNSFNKHSTTSTLDQEVYLKILCSMQFEHQQKASRKELQNSIPTYYLEQVKYSKYRKFLNYTINSSIFKRELYFKIAKEVQQIVCQKGEDVYDYTIVSEFKDDLFYLDQGEVDYSLGGWETSHFITKVKINPMANFGYFGFISGLKLPHTAICCNYSVILMLSRKKYKQCLQTIQQKMAFTQKQLEVITLSTFAILDNQPLYKYKQFSLQYQNQVSEYHVLQTPLRSFPNSRHLQSGQNLRQTYQESGFSRKNIKSAKTHLGRNMKVNASTQTNPKCFQTVFTIQVAIPEFFTQQNVVIY